MTKPTAFSLTRPARRGASDRAINMKTHFLIRCLLACFLTLAVTNGRADEEQDLIATLQSTARAAQKCTACLRLKRVGTAKSVPALAALLGEESTAHAARSALESLPGSEAGAALREAVGRASGPIKAGLLDSLGWRHEAESVPLLVKSLSDADITVAAAAAAALGRIGGNDATAALIAVRDQAPPAVQGVVIESLLQCAEHLRARGETAGAAALCRDLVATKFPPQLRAAAWRGLVWADTAHRPEFITQALAGNDGPLHIAALKLVRELDAPQVIEACCRQWVSLPADSQLAVLEAHLKLGAVALPTVRAATESPHSAVRAAAWQALAEINLPSTIPALAKAAAHGELAEREAARSTLARLHGPGMREALLDQLGRAETGAKAELLRSLGERGDAGAVNVLLQHAGAGTGPVRLAALESLRKLAVEDTIAPLLDLAVGTKSETDREPILQALSAVCLASQNKEQAARRVLEIMARTPAAQRRLVLPLLADVATPAALDAAQAATQDPDLELAREGVRVLSQWPSAAPASHLLELARTSADSTMHALALRGCLTVAAHEPDGTRRFAMLQPALAAARRVEEKRQALGQIGQIYTPAALEAVLPHLKEPGLENEAEFAALQIAGHLPWTQRAQAEAALRKLAADGSSERTRSEAQAAWQTLMIGSGWLAAGPYRQEGKQAQQLFDLPFAPEQAAAAVEWYIAPGKTNPQADSQVDLSDAAGGNHCVMYLKTRLFAPEARSVSLAIASDDGLKLWVNGQLAHSTNAVRGIGAGRDRATAKLRQGWNDFLAKVTQHTAGCGIVLQITDAKGVPVAGLRFDPQGGGATPTGVPPSKP